MKLDAHPKVVIIGGGISGLTIGYELISRGLGPHQITILEAAAKTGGNIKTEKVDDFSLEAGPNGFLTNSPPTLELVSRLSMDDRLLRADATSAVRFIYSRGKLRKVPTSPGQILVSGMLPLAGRLRIFAEPFIPKGGFSEETVYDFASRRIGKSAASIMVDAMVSGVFAGNAKNLELKSAFPKMANMEATYGGLVKSLIALQINKARGRAKTAGSAAGPGGHLTSFKEGLEELPQRLSCVLKDSIKTGSRVKEIKKNEAGYSITLENGRSSEAEAVVIACSAFAASKVVENVDSELSSKLKEIKGSPIAVVATAYPKNQVENPKGFGFLVPREQGPRILGCLWTSSIWKEHRSPGDKILLRTMIGGAHDPQAMNLDNEQLLEIVKTDLQTTMGFTAQPVFNRIYRHKNGISQYTPGHAGRLEKIYQLLKKNKGLFVSGSSYNGISVNHSIAQAPGVAVEIIDYISSFTNL